MHNSVRIQCDLIKRVSDYTFSTECAADKKLKIGQYLGNDIDKSGLLILTILYI